MSHLLNIANPVDVMYTRYSLYLNSLARESRIQIDAAFHLFIVVVLYLLGALATFDDASEERLELLNLAFFSYFGILIIFLM